MTKRESALKNGKAEKGRKRVKGAEVNRVAIQTINDVSFRSFDYILLQLIHSPLDDGANQNQVAIAPLGRLILRLFPFRKMARANDGQCSGTRQ